MQFERYFAQCLGWIILSAQKCLVHCLYVYQGRAQAFLDFQTVELGLTLRHLFFITRHNLLLVLSIIVQNLELYTKIKRRK